MDLRSFCSSWQGGFVKPITGGTLSVELRSFCSSWKGGFVTSITGGILCTWNCTLFAVNGTVVLLSPQQVWWYFVRGTALLLQFMEGWFC